jgi:putative DNA primase/helicase
MHARDGEGELNLASHIEAVARRLLGEPNKRMSMRRQLRYGNKGALAVNVAGKRQGFWRDFAMDSGGGVLDLVVRERGGTRADAFAWLRDQQLVDAASNDEIERKERSYGGTAPAPGHALAPWACRLWKACRPITRADPAGRYLLSRGCAPPHADGDLRWHPALRHPCGHVGPALIGLVTAAGDASRWMTLHRTWVQPDGRKADVDPPRLLLKDHSKAGVVRLSPDDAVTLGLGLGEGIETTLTLARVFTPVWSCLDAGNLAAFPVLRGIESISVCVDHDAAGLRAFDMLADRWTAAGREVRRVLAPVAGADLNDWKNQRA